MKKKVVMPVMEQVNALDVMVLDRAVGVRVPRALGQVGVNCVTAMV